MRVKKVTNWPDKLTWKTNVTNKNNKLTWQTNLKNLCDK